MREARQRKPKQRQSTGPLCTCGTCRKCVHRAAVRKSRQRVPDAFLALDQPKPFNLGEFARGIYELELATICRAVRAWRCRVGPRRANS
jgi:hypothetical protein